MEKKASTLECQLFLTAHYAQKKIDTKKEDWSLQKKYKDLEGNTCRDFYHENLGLEAIVVSESKSINGENFINVESADIQANIQSDNNKDKDKIETEKDFYLRVMENSSYMIFVREKLNKPTYYFAPFVNNNGFIVYVEDARRYDQFQKFEDKPRGQKPYVLDSLKKIFKDRDIVSLREDNMFVSFPNSNIDFICQTLMKKHWIFCPEFFERIQSSGYLPYHPDIDYVKYSFPEHKGLDKKATINSLYEFVNENGDIWKRGDYAKIQSLIEKISIEDLLKIKSSVVDLRSGDEKLALMINAEINKKRSFQIFNRIAYGNIAQEN